MDLPVRTQSGPSSHFGSSTEFDEVFVFAQSNLALEKPNQDRARHWGETDTLSGVKSWLEHRRDGLVANKDLEYAEGDQWKFWAFRLIVMGDVKMAAVRIAANRVAAMPVDVGRYCWILQHLVKVPD